MGVLDGDAQRVIACQHTGGLIVIDEVEDRAGVVAAGITAQLVDGLLNRFSVHIRFMLRRYIALTLVAAEAYLIEIHIHILIRVILNILRLHHALADMHIKRLQRQDKLEELVTRAAHGADLGQVPVIGKQGAKAGDAALHLDLDEHVGFGQAVLRTRLLVRGIGDIVHHDRIIVTLGQAGEDGRVIRRLLRLRLRGGSGWSVRRAAGRSGLVAARREHGRRQSQDQKHGKKFFHLMVSCCSDLFSISGTTASFRVPGRSRQLSGQNVSRESCGAAKNIEAKIFYSAACQTGAVSLMRK